MAATETINGFVWSLDYAMMPEKKQKAIFLATETILTFILQMISRKYEHQNLKEVFRSSKKLAL